MIDSVLKGSGNSRFLKSAVPAGTSWADALAMLQAGTFPIDFNGINTEGFQQVGTPLNKANLLKDATAAQIGLSPSTTPDGMFQALGNTGELHVWRKTEKVGSKGYYLDAVSSGQLCIVNSSAYVVTFSYSSTVSAEGVLSGTVNTVSLSGTNDQTSKLSVLRGKFCKAESNGASDSVFSGIIYIPNDATFTYQRDNGDYRSHHVNKKQTVVFTDALTTTTYPVSTNPNAYQEGDDAKAAGYVVGEEKNITINGMNGPILLTGNSLTVADDGTLSVTSPAQHGVYNSSTTEDVRSVVAGKYIYIPYNSGSVGFFKVPSDVLVTGSTAPEGGSVFAFTAQPVTGYPAIPAGTTIEYLGKLGDKARAQVVSYVGTGTYGESNPCSITVDFPPKVVFILCWLNTNSQFCQGMLSPLLDYGFCMVSGYSGYGDCAYLMVKSSGNKITWTGKDSYYQLNYSGVKYYAIAIG